MFDGFALRVKNTVLKGDVNFGFHELFPSSSKRQAARLGRLGNYCMIFGALDIGRAAFGQNAEATRHFLVGLFNIAEIAAEAVLVHLFVGVDVQSRQLSGLISSARTMRICSPS